MPPSMSPRRRHLLATTAALAAGTLFAPFARAAEGWQTATLPLSIQRDLTSTITGQHYRIFVSIPPGAVPEGGHPVLYALDGNATFPTLSLMARATARRPRDGSPARHAPVVVGIGYAVDQPYSIARGRDYTPPTGSAGPATEGGVELFLDFIERELKPLIATLAPLDPRRQALYGHSYGGLCTLHALFTRPAMFQTYLAASPSIWYGEQAVLANEKGLGMRLAALASTPSLMMTVGELEQPAPNAAVLDAHAAVAAKRRMVNEARDLAARLQADGALARVQFQVLPNENHGSAMFPAMARGLEFFLG